MLYDFAHDRFAGALAEARKIDAPNVVFGLMAEAAALAGLRRQSEARRLIKAIEDIDPRYLERSAADLLRRRFEPELASKLVRTLRTRAQE